VDRLQTYMEAQTRPVKKTVMVHLSRLC